MHSTYVARGPVRIGSTDYLSGDRPTSTQWRPEVPLPIGLFGEFSVLRVGE